MHKRIILAILIFITSFLIPMHPVSAQSVSGPIYIVKSGDSLSSIAEFFSVNLSELMDTNGIADANQLFVGQELVIPNLDGITGILNIEIINFGDSFRSLMRRTQIPADVFKKLNHVVSPSQFYVGVGMIVPSVEESQGLGMRISTSPGESLFELAVKQNTDVWTLSEVNDLQGTWNGMPGDTIFAPGGDGAQSTGGLPSAFVSANIRDLPIKQGGTGVITVQTIPGVILGGLLVDHSLHFFPMGDGTQVALQGVHALLNPGVYPLRLDATLPDGSMQSYEQSILITSGYYPDDPLLYVDPITIEPASTEPELQQLVLMTTPSNPTKYWSGGFISPATAYPEAALFTSKYGNRRTYIGQGTELQVQGFHTGLDYGGGTGLPISAPAAGQVIFAGFLTVRGNATIIDHGWGVYSGFWHQSEINVQVGDIVAQGQVIGLVGGTGRVTGPHLHWELWANGIQVDPLDWLIQSYP